MRAELLYESAADELKKKLPSLRKIDYSTIDNLMQRISKRYKITGKKLHDLFVSKYGHTPDTWIKKYKEKLGEEGVAEGTGALSVQQLATISDEALDNAYHYGRSTPGNTFGWQANLMSAAYAKRMIEAGVTDIEKISDAIHKGWNVTAQKFVQDPSQFDDSAKLQAAGKLEAKLQQRAQLMKQHYAQLPDEEQEKDRVVARALLQAIRGTQGVAEDSKESYMIIRTDAEGKKDVFAGNFDTYEQAQKELDGLLDHPLHTKYKQKFEIKRKGGEQGMAEGSEPNREAGKAIQNLKNLALMKSALTSQQLTQAGRESIITDAIKACIQFEQSYLQNKQQGNAIFVRALRDEIDNFRKGYPINTSMPEDTTPELGDLLQGKLGKVNFQQGVAEEKQRLDPKCWTGYKKQGTKMKGDTRVNNCVPAESVEEDWNKVNKKDKTSGMSQKAVNAYRRENPGSKLKTAVTTKPSKLKPGSKAAKRRKSFCARMGGMKKAHASAKTKRDPDSPINKALRRWNCESIEELQQLTMIAEQKIAEAKNPAMQAAIAIAKKKERMKEGEVLQFPNKQQPTKPNVSPLQKKKQVTQRTTSQNVVPIAKKPAGITWKKLPKDVLKLANDWFWADMDDGGSASALDPKGYGSGTRNQLQFITAQLQQRGWNIDNDDEFANVLLTNKTGQSVLLPRDDAYDFKGWAAGTNSHLRESIEQKDDVQKIKEFIKWSMITLNIEKPYPKFTLSRDTEQAQKGHRTGMHTGDRIWVYIENRNLVDIFRTIFHELVHHRQDQLGMIKHGDSYPGSPIEALADMMAGKYMKIYGQEHPDIFQ